MKKDRTAEFEERIKALGADSDPIIADRLESYQAQMEQIAFIGKLVETDRRLLDSLIDSDDMDTSLYKKLDDKYERHSRMFNSACGSNDKTCKLLSELLDKYEGMMVHDKEKGELL